VDLRKLQGLAEHCSNCKRRAEAAERKLVKRRILAYLADRVGDERLRLDLRLVSLPEPPRPSPIAPMPLPGQGQAPQGRQNQAGQGAKGPLRIISAAPGSSGGSAVRDFAMMGQRWQGYLTWLAFWYLDILRQHPERRLFQAR